ncbi:MAG: 1-acyl-sn-glycerol-3-phosphate acyltransferase [Polyangiaceae bacterium]
MAPRGLFGDWLAQARTGRAVLNAPLRRLSERFLAKIEVDDAWREAVSAAHERGPVVYVVRNVSVRDYLALDHLTRRLDLPEVGFANEIPDAVAPRLEDDATTPAEELRRCLSTGHSAILFLKRAPSGAAGRGRREGAALLETLITLQQGEDAREIMLLPQMFIWSQRAEKRRFSVVDTLFGPVDFPGELRQASQMVLHDGDCRLRVGDALSLRDFLAATGDDPQTEALARRLTYALVRTVERERRVVVGPAHKAPDRVREEVIRSPKLQKLIGELAGPKAEDRAVLEDKARDMLREMQTIPDADAQRNMVMLAERILTQIYAGIDVDEEGLDRLRALNKVGSVVLLPSHKSHVDYIVLSYILRKNGIQIPVIAAGDNLSFFPAGPVLRRGGAFFIRRSFRGDRLYTAVVDAYMRRLLKDGWMIEFFLEGGRSRTGKLLPPMLGLLNMIVASALGVTGREVFFLPIAIGYERLMEEGAFARELSGQKKEKEDASALLKVGGLLTETWGRVNLQFGDEIELGALRDELGIDPNKITPARRRNIVKNLAHRVMSEINHITAVTPGHLVALVLLSRTRGGVPYRELVAQCRRLLAMLLEQGARTTPSLADDRGRMHERGIRQALQVYVRGGLLEQHVPGDTLTAEAKRRARLYTGTDVIFTAPADKRIRLDIAKNHIIHRLVDRSLVALALRTERTPRLAQGELRERVRSLSRLFKYEFMFRADAPFETIFDDVVREMMERNELAAEDGAVAPGAGHDGLDGDQWVRFYTALVVNFVESYQLAAKSLEALLKGPADAKDLAKSALKTGERMFLQGEITCSEAVSQPVIVNAYDAFVDAGYLVRREGKLELAETFASPEAAASIEKRIAAFRPDDGGW